MKTVALALITAVLTFSSGCAFIDAGLRSANDDRRTGRYESKSYGQHLLDATFEERPRRTCRPRTRVIVCHCHGPCDHG